ncbi:MAG: sigma-54-dependent Fis family transcriptional regulator [Clostridiales bacterium]|nr:sigma-54-dependent Fis family transcriptional regulator [Clostridiales bacterium]
MSSAVVKWDVGIKVERLQSFLARLLQAVGEEIPSARTDIAFLGENNTIAFRQSWPPGDSPAPPFVEASIHSSVSEGQPLLIDPGSPSLRDGHPGRARECFLCVPFMSGNRPIGAICLSRDASSKPYSQDDLEYLLAIASPFFHVLKSRLLGRNTGEDAETRPESGPVIGVSRSSHLIQTLIDRVKDTDAPVFICGESGTGKELIARAIHERGLRKEKPFVAVNCGAIPDHLLESELFGHARGAFTGALRDKAGLIEEANGGTFFLDEIGDLPLPLQSKLLRLLQEREIRRIGENRTKRVDVRFVSATNKNIEKEIELGNFRVDLYYRLRILTIDVPPLRERKNDLLLFINYFVDKYCREMKRERAFFSPRALDLLMDYAWPGNIRELQSEIQRCLILAGDGGLIKEEHLSQKINPQKEVCSTVSYSYSQAKAEFEMRFLNQALLRFGHNKARTAEGIGLSRQGLFKLLKKHGLV